MAMMAHTMRRVMMVNAMLVTSNYEGFAARINADFLAFGSTLG